MLLRMKKGLSWVGQIVWKGAKSIYTIWINYGFNVMIMCILLTIRWSIEKLESEVKDIQTKVENLQSKLGKVEDDDYVSISNDLLDIIIWLAQTWFPEQTEALLLIPIIFPVFW